MILITDGGSTKCDWILLDDRGKVLLKTRTDGLNPAVLSKEKLLSRIQSNKELVAIFSTVKVLDFYGAGCGTKTPVKHLTQVLSELFSKAEVSVNEDILAAVYAVTTKAGIVCILGTGSNSCYFDGHSIHNSVASLGYSVMDEASGNYYGKQLLRDYYYKQMPQQLADQFGKGFNLEADHIKLNLYQKANPNMYLASFAEFIFNAEDVNDYFYDLLREGMMKFVKYRILCFEEAQKTPIYFVGSIAHFSKDIIRECLKEHQLQLGNIIRRPIDGLIEYYRKYKLES